MKERRKCLRWEPDPYRITVGAMYKRQNAEIITRRGYYYNSSGVLYAKFIIRVFCVSPHYNSSPRYGFSCVRCIHLLLHSPFSLSRNWRVAARTGYAARWFRVSSFVSDAVSCPRCVRRVVTKHRNSYKRERSISEKQVALQFRPLVLFMIERRQEAVYAD